METVTIYRVEHKAIKIGPYNYPRTYAAAGLPYNPGPIWEDVIPFERGKHVFGLYSKQQIDRWFPAEWRAEWAHEFDLLVFKVPTDKALKGQVQVAFERPARAYRRLPLTTTVDALPV